MLYTLYKIIMYVCFDEVICKKYFPEFTKGLQNIKDMNPDADFKTTDKSGHTLIPD